MDFILNFEEINPENHGVFSSFFCYNINNRGLKKGTVPMDISDKPDKLKSLEMAKKHSKKVYITDIAIEIRFR